jgi:putative nucleotidyltransferase with HDIG domain
MSQSFVSLVEAQIASGKTKLPVFEGTALKLQRMLAAPPEDTKPLADLLGSDPVLASAVLRLANSSFYGGLAQVKTIPESLLRLGMDQVMRLALVVSQQQAYRVSAKDLKPVVSKLWAHALATALGSQWLAQKLGRGAAASEAFLAGMVHDIGKLLVIRVIDDLGRASADFRPPASLVSEMLASLHALYGATLARGWNLPESYVRVIEHHHDAELPAGDVLLAIVRLVDRAANGLGYGLAGKHEAQLAATLEAQALGLSDIAIAELEIHIDDAMQVAHGAAGGAPEARAS